MVINPNDDVLLRSARTGNTIEALLALETGADVHCDGDEALYSANWRGSAPMVRLLLEHGVDAASRKSAGAIQAASFEYREIVEMLVKHGASDDALCVLELVEQGFNLSGKAPLGLLAAARFGLLRETKVLLQHSRNDFERKTVILAYAHAENGNHQDIVTLLSEYLEKEGRRHGATSRSLQRESLQRYEKNRQHKRNRCTESEIKTMNSTSKTIVLHPKG